MRDDPTRSGPPEDDDSSIDEIREVKKEKRERLEEIPERRWYKTRELTPYEEAMENYRKREESRVDWIAEEKGGKKERLEEVIPERRDYRRQSKEKHDKVRIYKTSGSGLLGAPRTIRNKLQRTADVVADASDPIANWYYGREVNNKRAKKKHIPGAKETFFAGVRSANTLYLHENRSLRKEGRVIEREFSLLGGIEKPRHKRERQYRSAAREHRATYATPDEIGMGMLGFVSVGKRDYGRDQWTTDRGEYHGAGIRHPLDAFALGMPKKKKGGSGIPDFFNMKF